MLYCNLIQIILTVSKTESVISQDILCIKHLLAEFNFQKKLIFPVFSPELLNILTKDHKVTS
jgi:hypothetical protein